jgi:hypothetical protein
MNFFRIKSDLPLTVYAPQWNYLIGDAQWADNTKIDKIRQWLIDNEDYIKQNYQQTHDGLTGLGPDSVTARFGSYNLFDFIPKLPELDDMLTFMRRSYLEYKQYDLTNIAESNITCWYNIVRNGQDIDEHLHNAGSWSYLTGNMHLDNYPTKTYYRSAYNILENEYYPVPNIKGGLTIFPSCVLHRADTFNETSRVRVSLAFDIRLGFTGPHETKGLKGYPFMNENIFNQLAKAP